MSDALKEQLSSWLDGELPDAQLDLLLKRLERDEEMQKALSRYALISESLKDRPALPSAQFAARVMSAVDAAPVEIERERMSPQVRARVRTATGAAIAASIAAVAIVAVQRNENDLEMAAQTTRETPFANVQTMDRDLSYAAPSARSSSAFVPAARLTNYVVAHSEYSSPLGRRSMLSGVLSEDDHAAAVGELVEISAPAR